MRSSLARRQIDLDETVERHRLLVAAIATKRRPTIVKAIREHYLDPREPERKSS
jgi:DNA-binding GntR family transcriptional regulator